MALQIEAPKSIKLIEELSRRTGESAETVVEIALQEFLARLRTPEEEAERRARLQELTDRLASRIKEPYRSLDLEDWLYDEDGLPK